MNKVFNSLLGCILLTALPAIADDPYDSLVFVFDNGQKIAVPSAGLSMSIADNSIIAVSPDTELSIPLSSLSEFHFDRMAGIGIIEALTDADIDVVSLDGHQCGNFPSLEEARKSLQPGVYVVTWNNYRFKIVCK